MEDYKLFHHLRGKTIKPPLTKGEKEEIWNSIKEKLYVKKKKRFSYRILAIAALLILSLGLGFFYKFNFTKKEDIKAANIYNIPMIENWEGNPDIIYETQTQDVRIAFVVDSNIKWE